MRLMVATALVLFLPWAGCIDDAAPARIGLFAFAPAERGDPTPLPIGDCVDLLTTLNDRALLQARVGLEQSAAQQTYGHLWSGRGMVVEDVVEMSAASDGAAHSAGGAEVTGTNNQEAGVDEADLVKTDGEWTYVIHNGVLRILHSENVGDIAEQSRMEFGSSWGGVLLLEARDAGDPFDDRLIVILPNTYPQGDAAILLADDTASSSSYPGYYGGMTRIVTLSLRDRIHPTIEDEAWIEGDLKGARLVEGTVYVVVHRYERGLGLQSWAYPDEQFLNAEGLTWETYSALPEFRQAALREKIALQADARNLEVLQEVELRDHLPRVLRSVHGLIIPEPVNEPACDRVLATPGSTGRGFSTILAVAVDDQAISTSTTQVLGGSPIVYASMDALVLAAPTQDAWWFWAQPELDEATDLQWFKLDGLAVTPIASGRVIGTVRDSFGIDVHDDALRVATTTGSWARWWTEQPVPMLNHVAVFDVVAGQLVLRGIAGGIAPGERIWSARFTDDRAYIVTFRDMDPLWVVDLTDIPKVLGELEIPGVSTYLHPLDDDTILAMGYGPLDGDLGMDWSRIQVSLFDISDLANPRRADVLDLTPGGTGTWSSAVQEHKAFTYWDALGVLALPLTSSTSSNAGGMYHEDFHITLQLIDVDRAKLDLSLRGEVDQDHLVDAGTWAQEIERSYFLGYPQTGPVSVYAVSPLGVTAHDLDTLQRQDSVAFS